MVLSFKLSKYKLIERVNIVRFREVKITSEINIYMNPIRRTWSFIYRELHTTYLYNNARHFLVPELKKVVG